MKIKLCNQKPVTSEQKPKMPKPGKCRNCLTHLVGCWPCWPGQKQKPSVHQKCIQWIC